MTMAMLVAWCSSFHMKSVLTLKCSLSVTLLVSLFVSPLPAQDSANLANLLPLNDNYAVPFMGIYEGAPRGNGIAKTNEYTQWLNRSLIWAHGSGGWDNWDGIDKAPWLFPQWGAWVAAMPGRRLVFSIPLLPKNPKEGGITYSLKEGAAGAYNSHYTALGKVLLANHLGNSILRLGWEFDGGWYPWKTKTPEEAADLAKYFRQVVTAMRMVPGLENLEFCWNGAGEPNKYPLEAAYPGDDVVNYVGLDIYDKTWAKGIYPYPPDATPEQRLEIQKKAWDDNYNRKRGIKEWLAFAKLHHKPMMIPEWGLWRQNKDGHGGLDDPYFVQQMYNLIHDPANNIYEAAYWDDREARVIPTAGYVSQYPESMELFRKLFSLPPTAEKHAPPPPPPAPVAPSTTPAPASTTTPPAPSPAAPITPSPEPPTTPTN